MESRERVVPFERLRIADVESVGGKNASLGEMVRSLGSKGIKVPAEFATTAATYWRYVEANGLRDLIAGQLSDLAAKTIRLAEAGEAIRRGFLRGEWPSDTAEALRAAYRKLGSRVGKAERSPTKGC